MKRQLIFTPSAEEDLRGIYDYTLTRWGIGQAARYMNLLRERYRELEMQPNLGKSLDGSQADLHYIKCEHHYAYYLVERETVTFIAFLHERMDMLRHITVRFETPH